MRMLVTLKKIKGRVSKDGKLKVAVALIVLLVLLSLILNIYFLLLQ